MAAVHWFVPRQDGGAPQFDFASFLNGTIITERLTLALTIWMFYDLVLTPQATLNMFVGRKITFPKILFLLNRYVTPWMMLLHFISLVHPNPSETVCRAAPWITIFANSFVVFCVSTALIARVHALWQNRRILIMLCTAFVIVYSGSSIYPMVYLAQTPGIRTPFPPPFTGCIWFPKANPFWIPFLVSGLFETTCICLTVWKTWFAVNAKETPTLYRLFHDGIIYYICIIALKIITVLSGFIPAAAPFTGSNAILAITSMLCTWIYMRLHSVLREQSTFSINSPRVVRLFNTPSSPSTLHRVNSNLTSSSKSSKASSIEGTVEHYWAWEKPLPPLPLYRNTMRSSTWKSLKLPRGLKKEGKF